MHIYFGIPWRLKSGPDVKTIKTDFAIMVSGVRFSLSRLWWYRLFRDDRTISIKA